MLAELSLLHVSYLVQDLRMADIRLASLVYLPCLRWHVLRAYCTFASKQAVSITLFGPRPNKKRAFSMKKQIYGSNHEWKAYPLTWLPLSVDDIATYLNFFLLLLLK